MNDYAGKFFHLVYIALLEVKSEVLYKIFFNLIVFL